MSRTLIGRTVRRLRTERELSQQALATRLGISASYLNLIEHDQRAVTASLLIKLGETLRVDLGELSGTQERQLQVGLREAFADPLLGADDVAEAEVEALAGRQSERREGGVGAVSRVAGGTGGCQRDRPAVRAPYPAAERGGAGLFRRSRQPFSDPGRGGRNAGQRTGAGRAGRDEPCDRRTAARGARRARDGAAAGDGAAPLRPGDTQPGAVGSRCRGKAAGFTWRFNSPCWRRGRRWRRC